MTHVTQLWDSQWHTSSKELTRRLYITADVALRLESGLSFAIPGTKKCLPLFTPGAARRYDACTFPQSVWRPIYSPRFQGPRKTETFGQKQDSCISGPISGQNVVLARVISRNGGFKRGRNRAFLWVLEIESEVQSIPSPELWDRLFCKLEA